MSSDRRSRPAPDPLFDAVDRIAQTEGLTVADLKAGDVVEVETRNHRYTFVVREPAKGKVEATNDGKHITRRCEAVIVGSLLGSGSMIRTGWIGVGYSLEVCANGKRYVLSRTRRIAVNGIAVRLRADGAAVN